MGQGAGRARRGSRGRAGGGRGAPHRRRRARHPRPARAHARLPRVDLRDRRVGARRRALRCRRRLPVARRRHLAAASAARDLAGGGRGHHRDEPGRDGGAVHSGRDRVGTFPEARAGTPAPRHYAARQRGVESVAGVESHQLARLLRDRSHVRGVRSADGAADRNRIDGRDRGRLPASAPRATSSNRDP